MDVIRHSKDLILKIYDLLLSSSFGRSKLWLKHLSQKSKVLTLPDAIDELEKRWKIEHEETDTEQPIFILSAGWRSGSTLLQRMVISGGDALIWGEPYAYADYVGKLAESIRIFRQDFPPNQCFLDFIEETEGGKAHEKWIAHMYPHPNALRLAHRHFFTTMLAEPAYQRGYSRWGLKDCHHGIEHALYLKWLFPRAKFLFIYRNPYDAYRSFRQFGAYHSWPDIPIFTARQYGRLWNNLLSGFLENQDKVDSLLVKFEDLVQGHISTRGIAEFLGVEYRETENVMQTKITGRGKRKLEALSRRELTALRREVDPLAQRLGYPA